MRAVAIVLLVIICSVFAASKCTSAALRVRSKPSTSGAILRTLPSGASVNVISNSNGWSKIGNAQYVSSQYLRACGSSSRPNKPATTPNRPAAPVSGGSSQGRAAAQWARSKVGGCYSQSRRDGNPCYDCSSLVYYAWRAAGKNIGATNTRMYPGNTRSVSSSSLQPGDILWRSGHAGMYIGNGRFVHAKGTAYGIREEPFRASSWTKFYRPN